MNRPICDYYLDSGYDESPCKELFINNLRNCFRLLWEQHVYWTRMAIMGIAFDLPDLNSTTNRLLRNAPDFAKVFNHFYGNEVAAKINHLITDHLSIAAELVTAAKAGKNNSAADAEKRWYANADAIACFLNRINPYWPIKPMKVMWYEHLALTKEEAISILKGNNKKSICTFDKIEKEALHMADTFSNGILKQFADCDF